MDALETKSECIVLDNENELLCARMERDSKMDEHLASLCQFNTLQK